MRLKLEWTRDLHRKSPKIDFSNFSLSRSHFCRFGSSSSQTSQTSGDFCRICHESDNIGCPLLTPCLCSGSLRYVHEFCLIQWLTASETNSCELCKFPFIMQSKIKPFNEVIITKKCSQEQHCKMRKTYACYVNYIGNVNKKLSSKPSLFMRCQGQPITKKYENCFEPSSHDLIVFMFSYFLFLVAEPWHEWSWKTKAFLCSFVSFSRSTMCDLELMCADRTVSWRS